MGSYRKLLFFHAKWCPPCRLFERELIVPLENAVGKEHIDRIDAQAEPFKADEYSVTRLPRAVLLDRDGSVAKWTVGIPDFEECVRFLKDDSGECEKGEN